MTKAKIVLLTVIGVLTIAFFALDLGRYLSLEFFTSQQAAIRAHVQAYPVESALVFFLIYITVTGLSLPGAALMTLIAGALFGLLWGTVIVSFASSAGATLAFLVSRFLLRDWVQRRFGEKL
jgi:uncharacterized membrane protein YdjX (TVP38/TMEM64 family)